jgi:hypothetical protein
MGREELAAHIAADTHTDAAEVRVDEVLVVPRARDERVEQGVHGAAHADVLAALAPVRDGRRDRSGEVRVVGDATRGDHLVVPRACSSGERGVGGHRGEALRGSQCVDLRDERGLVSR